MAPARGRDRLVEQIKIGTPAPLSRDDLPSLVGGGRVTTSLQRIRASHHKVARLLAHGLTNKEVAGITGFTAQRISQLSGSPAMVELIAIYRERHEAREDEQLDAVTNLMAENLLAAQRHIADAFDEADENGELIPIRAALAVAADSADRLGYAKRQVNTNLNYDMGAALERAIARSGKGPVIDSVPVRTVPQSRPQPPKLPNSSAVEPARPLILRRA